VEDRLEKKFERELEVFQTEVEAATQFLYAFLAVHAVAADNKEVHKLLNHAPLFWNTNLGALQTAAFIVLGRIFDQNSTHNVDKLLRIAQDNHQIFLKEAFRRRRQGNEQELPSWLENYVQGVYEPTPEDFRRLRNHVKKWRKVYESNYRDVRRKFFAHKEVSERTQIESLFRKTNIRELQRMLSFLRSLHESLQQLFLNGRKPILRPNRYSIKRIREIPTSVTRSESVQERIIHEAESFLTNFAE